MITTTSWEDLLSVEQRAALERVRNVLLVPPEERSHFERQVASAIEAPAEVRGGS